MSLETTIADLNKTMSEVVVLLKQDIELREQGLQTISKASEKLSGTKASAKAEPKAKEEKPAVESKAVVENAKPEEGDDRIEQIRSKMAEYIGGTDREEERTARKSKIRDLINHEKVKKEDAPENTTNLGDIKPGALNAVLKKIQQFIADGDLTKPASDTDDDLDLD